MERLLGPSLAGPRQGSARAASAARTAGRLPLVLFLTVAGLFLPEELSFYLFGLRLTVVRLIFLLVAPVLVVRALNKLSSGFYRFLPSDLFVIVAGFWLIYAPVNIDGVAPALNHAGPTVLEFCVGYFATRFMLRGSNAALAFANVLCSTIAVVALVGALDPITNHWFVHDWGAQFISPRHVLSNWEDRYRFGLLRATGPVEHPILFGFVCAIGMLIAISVPIRRRLFVILACGLGTMLSLSSAPIQVAILGLGLLTYNFFVPRYRWSLLLVAVGFVVFVAFAVSNNPLGFIISTLTFSPDTGYYRVWTWEMVHLYVSQSPWFGLGFGKLPEDIDHSIDSLWLVLSIRAGYPGAVLVGLSLLGAIPLFTGGRRSELTSAESRLNSTLAIVLLLTFYMAFTVHIWGSAWVLVGLLIGLKAHLGEVGYVRGRLARQSPNVSFALRPDEGIARLPASLTR
jgi:hypothetical protein